MVCGKVLVQLGGGIQNGGAESEFGQFWLISQLNSLPSSVGRLLFFFPDQHRFDWLGHNKDIPVRTPNLDNLADRGAFFVNAVCPSPLCAPSRACLAAGKEYDLLIFPDERHSPRRLRDRIYMEQRISDFFSKNLMSLDVVDMVAMNGTSKSRSVRNLAGHLWHKDYESWNDIDDSIAERQKVALLLGSSLNQAN